jgi:hypothetical protein
MTVAGAPEVKPKLDLESAALFLGVRPRTLAEKKWRLRHAIPTFLVGDKPTFDVDELARWLEAHRESDATGEPR